MTVNDLGRQHARKVEEFPDGVTYAGVTASGRLVGLDTRPVGGSVKVVLTAYGLVAVPGMADPDETAARFERDCASNGWHPSPTTEEVKATIKSFDPVNHPKHYTSHPAKCSCGASIECIQVTEHMGFNLGNAVKYLWRADLKGAASQDLEKAKWYIEREIAKRKAEQA